MGQLGTFIFDHWLLFLALLVTTTLLVLTSVRPKLLGYSELNVAESVHFMNCDDGVTLDVRDENEFEEAHLLNALNIPQSELEQRIADLDAYRSQPILVYCRTGQRSARAAVLLKRQGFDPVYKMSGGMLAWQAAKMPVSKNDTVVAEKETVELLEKPELADKSELA